MIAAVAQIPAYDGTITVYKLLAMLLLLMITVSVVAADGKGLKLSKAGALVLILLGLLGVLVWYA